jgi:ribosomal protein S25
MRTQQKKEKKELKAAAKKSLDPGHWTKEIMNAEAKFSSKVEENLEDKLSKESVSNLHFITSIKFPKRYLQSLDRLVSDRSNDV